MRKLDKIEIVFILAAIFLTLLGGIEAHRVASVFSVDDPELLYTYDTVRIGIPILLVYMYIMIWIKYGKKTDSFSYAIRATYIPIMLGLYCFGYLFGLNINHIRGIEGAFQYDLVLPFYVTGILFVALAFVNFYISLKNALNWKNRTIIIPIQLIIILLYLLYFSTVITDPIYQLGGFDAVVRMVL